MAVMTRPEADRLPTGAMAVEPQGLLAHVRRPCPHHNGDAVCVGRHEDHGCLVFWCERGEHHFHTR